MNKNNLKIRSTTILGVRSKGKVAVAGDGQVTLGDMAMKQKAVKVRKFDSQKGGVVGGFAGAAADALTLFEKFEQKLDEYEGDLIDQLLRWLKTGELIRSSGIWRPCCLSWTNEIVLLLPVMGT